MKLLFLFMLLLCVTQILNAEKPSKNPFFYSAEITGDKITFQKIEKEHLGKRVAVYMKSGFPNKFVGGPLPTGALLTDPETQNKIWIGELHAITKEGIRIRWYYEADRTACTEYGAESAEIDFIVVETENKKMANKALHPTPTRTRPRAASVTHPASAGCAPAVRRCG